MKKRRMFRALFVLAAVFLLLVAALVSWRSVTRSPSDTMVVLLYMAGGIAFGVMGRML